ncbi:MAG: acetate--CoA ligase family protein [Candidatus Moraniibacteriota bacterium]
MQNEYLDRLFSPRSIALIGASTRLGSVGNDIAKNLIFGGYKGDVYPINPKTDELYGKHCYQDVAKIGTVPDLAIIVVPAAGVPDVMRQLVALGVHAAVIISSGFRETGKVGAALEAEIADIATKGDIALLGPNCLGFINPVIRLNASFAPRLPRRGGIGMLSQSGALMTAILDISEGSIGFSRFISTGNKAALDEKDFLSYLASDTDTDVIAFYAEGLSDASVIVGLGRDIISLPLAKPIVALKSGRSESGKRASGSHTGSLAGTDAAYDALFRQSRILRADTVREFLDTLSVFSKNPLPAGPRVTIVTNAGGLGVITADAATEVGLVVSALTPQTTDALRTALPPAASAGNPIDILGDAQSDRYRIALDLAANDADTDAMIVILTPQSMTEGDETAHAIVNVRKSCGKPVLAVFAGGHTLDHGVSILREAGVSVFAYPEEAANALGLLVQVQAWRRKRFSPARSFSDVDRGRAAIVIAQATNEHREQLTEKETTEVLSAYGFPMLQSQFVDSPENALKTALEIGTRVALKIASPDIVHKTDAGGVMLDVPAEEVEIRYAELLDRVREKLPDARLDGVTVMEMGSEGGKELILGVKRESGLGTLLLVGMGGIYTETLKDVSFRFAPIVPDDATEMLTELKSFPILKGVRGEAGIDLDIVTECLLRLSVLVTDFPQISELDINPLSAHADRTRSRVLDARITID